MTQKLQERIFLNLLDQCEENDQIKNILKSPLGLSEELIRLLFENKFNELNEKLDKIKKFVAGITRSEYVAKTTRYSLASYYPNMFAFHQFFNSSYRARQGKVLEKMLMTILEEYTECDQVPEKPKDIYKLVSSLFQKKLPKLDIDVCGTNSSINKLLLLQIRSRDDTGGTTAKGSLVDLLREFLRTGETPSKNIHYLVCVWDERDSQQKKSTIKKMHSSIKDLVDIQYDTFENEISDGILITDRITLQLAYGTEEIVNALFKWSEKKDEKILKSISKTISYVENWDDLWIAYAISNLELENKYLHGHSNVELLEQKLDTIKADFNHSSYEELVNNVDAITNELITIWNEDSIPLDSLSDKAHYIRDLLFLKIIYNKKYGGKQKSLFFFSEKTNSDKINYESCVKSNQIKPEMISFRKLIPEIENTGYVTHSSHYYPAKFIPQVVRYYIERFTKPQELIIDPFAGCGTVGLECYICNRNSFLIDINPIINHIMPVKIYEGKEKLNEKQLIDCIKQVQQSRDDFVPNWKTINSWYPQEIFETLTNYWGGQRQLENNIYSLIIETALLRISKQFSYAEHKVPKLFRSKRKIQSIEKLLNNNWKRKLNNELSDLSLSTLHDVNELIELTKNNDCYVTTKGGVDSSTFDYNQIPKFDGLITSPPYLQAQEYIRTSKLDLFWLGYSEDNIKKLSKLEIPYRKLSRIIDTKTLNDVKSKINRPDLIKLTDSYFSLTIDALERAMNNMKTDSTACIFIGNPTVDGNIVEIWRVFMEYFAENGFSFEGVYEDRIKTRQLFGGRNNKNPSGMKSEYLLMLRKN